jgi:hypothetical protein
MQVLDAACGSALSAGSDQRPVDPAAAPLRQCRPAQQAGEAVSAWLEESQPPRGDNVTIGLRGQDRDVMRGGGDPGDEVLAEPVPVLAPDSGLQCGDPLHVVVRGDLAQDDTAGQDGGVANYPEDPDFIVLEDPDGTASASST